MSNKMRGYRFFRAILSPTYKFWYRPKVIGKENIPKEGAIILAGNHIHIMDQCNVIISTKRILHYMAKKEYFEGKTAWFFKATGCIPVDRSTKDENAKSKAIEVLEEKHALGIFPEGTRNGLKETKVKELYDKYFKDSDISYKEFSKNMKNNKKSFVDYLEELKDKKVITKQEFLDNLYDAKSYLQELIKEKKITKEDYYDHYLLPLKYGAVSMAVKTNAKIVPYAITGDYKFRGKNLVVNIGKPFIPDSDLEKANDRLAKEIKKLVKENEKNND